MGKVRPYAGFSVTEALEIQEFEVVWYVKVW